jgi:hypothetical protein
MTGMAPWLAGGKWSGISSLLYPVVGRRPIPQFRTHVP